MPEYLAGKTKQATSMPERWQRSAAAEAMAVYLDDWIEAQAILDRRITELRALRSERIAEKERGDWPPRVTPRESQSGGNTPINKEG